jgi:predicted protein tyrosine phosphatase
MIKIAISPIGNPLRRAVRSIDATHVISLVDPGKPVFVSSRIERANHLIRHFEDDLHGPNAPKLSDAVAITWFAKNLPEDARLVVHCHAGISRSPAGAWIVLVAKGWDAEDALLEIKRMRPEAWPNTTLMRLGGTVLGIPEWNLNDLIFRINDIFLQDQQQQNIIKM